MVDLAVLVRVGPQYSVSRGVLIASVGPVDSASHLDHVQRLAAQNPQPHSAEGAPISSLPLFERMKRSYGAHHRAYPQEYLPLDTGALSSVERRRLQEAGAGSEMLTIENTARIKIHMDTRQLFEETATKYSSCFNVGDWFIWNYPDELISPPCEQAQFAYTVDVGEAPVLLDGVRPHPSKPPAHARSPPGARRAGGRQHADLGGVGTHPDILGEPPRCQPPMWADGRPGEPLDPVEPRRAAVQPELRPGRAKLLGRLPPRGRYPAGHDAGLHDHAPEGAPFPQPPRTRRAHCSRAWRWQSSVAEIESLLRVRPRAANLLLPNSVGHFSAIYSRAGLSTAAECAKDARLMYRLPVPDSYCTGDSCSFRVSTVLE
jgi:hypothetical protein